MIDRRSAPPTTIGLRRLNSKNLELVPGRNEWEARVDFGSLRFRGDFTETNFTEEHLIEYSWGDAKGLHTSGRVNAAWRDPGEDIVLERVPAGTLQLTRGGESWREVEIRAGEETVVDVP